MALEQTPYGFVDDNDKGTFLQSKWDARINQKSTDVDEDKNENKDTEVSHLEQEIWDDLFALKESLAFPQLDDPDGVYRMNSLDSTQYPPKNIEQPVTV